MKSAAFLLSILILAGTVPMLSAGSKKEAPPKKTHGSAAKANSHPTHDDKWERDPIVFSVNDRAAMRKHYRDRAAGLPPGLAKRNGDLPPGLRKQLRRNGKLPPGLQKKIEPLPEALELRLSPLRRGYSRGMIGRDAVIIEARTQRIIDIFRDVTARR